MSNVRHVVKAALSGLLIAVAALAQAQTQTVIPDINLQTIYRLTENASFQEGCFDPCLCPLGGNYDARGTFLLGPATPGDVVDFREVSQVNWRVHFEDNVVHRLTGAGVYRITNFGPTQQHSLDLDLAIDGQPAQHFFSDFVPVSANDEAIDLTVSINGVFCHDIVIRVDASPVPRHEIRGYELGNGSHYQMACFDPCDCVSQEPRPMRGHFQLVPLLDLGTYAEYAMVNTRFFVRSPYSVDSMLMLSGSGVYTLIQGFAGPIAGMELSLSINDPDPLLFDQELENTNSVFPAIAAVVDLNEMICSDTVLTLRARPLAFIRPALVR